MISVETLIAMFLILVIFITGICLLLDNVDMVEKYSERYVGSAEDVATNVEVMRIAQVVFDYLE